MEIGHTPQSDNQPRPGMAIYGMGRSDLEAVPVETRVDKDLAYDMAVAELPHRETEQKYRKHRFNEIADIHASRAEQAAYEVQKNHLAKGSN